MNEHTACAPAWLDRRALDLLGIDPPRGVLSRLGITTEDVDTEAATTTMSLSLSGMCNPLTGRETIAPLAALVDSAAGAVNHFRRADDQWTVTSELTLEVVPGLAVWAASGAEQVVVRARALDASGPTALSACEFRYDGRIVGVATARSFFISTDDVRIESAHDEHDRSHFHDLAALIAVEPATTHASLHQRPDPGLNNAIGVVNGGISSTALELVASAAIDTAELAMRTASLRVNFLRPFRAGGDAHYQGRALRIGGRSAVAEAEAVNDDGTVALVARLTAYC